MGVGNQGGGMNAANKASNHNYEHRSLLTLGSIAAFVGAGATEATAVQILAAIQSGTEFEARLVEDTLNVTWLEVRTWNTSTGGWNLPLYYPPGSNTPGTPTGAVVYINNSSVLAMIEANTTGINLEVTQLLIKGVLDAIALDTANLDVALSTVGTEITLAALLTELQLKADLSETQPVSQANTLRVPLLQRISGASNPSDEVASGKRSVAFFNAGPVDATVATGVLKPGESISFDAGGQGDTLGAIPYVTIATGDLVITTVA
jgi:hypothetical protein